MWRVILGLLAGTVLAAFLPFTLYSQTNAAGSAIPYLILSLVASFGIGMISAWIAGRLELLVAGLSLLIGVIVASVFIFGEVDPNVLILIGGQFGIFAVAGGGLVALLRGRQNLNRNPQ